MQTRVLSCPRLLPSPSFARWETSTRGPIHEANLTTWASSTDVKFVQTADDDPSKPSHQRNGGLSMGNCWAQVFCSAAIRTTQARFDDWGQSSGRSAQATLRYFRRLRDRQRQTQLLTPHFRQSRSGPPKAYQHPLFLYGRASGMGKPHLMQAIATSQNVCPARAICYYAHQLKVHKREIIRCATTR